MALIPLRVLLPDLIASSAAAELEFVRKWPKANSIAFRLASAFERRADADTPDRRGPFVTHSGTRRRTGMRVVTLPELTTSGAEVTGRFGKQAFVY